ncbi:MAG: saccharopine dehydrogenase C-terminal domain-containing protein [Bacteroidota bacterium]
MNSQYNIIIAGAGGIAQAAGLMLVEWSSVPSNLFIGNRTLSKAQQVAHWIETGSTKPCSIETFHLQDEITTHMKEVFLQGNILLDCLPGTLAPKMALLAKEYHLHYVNLTEYVKETEEIIALAKNSSSGFILQSGLAPGYINVLANHLFTQFCNDFEVEKVDKVEMKVGALTDHAVAPHYYGFTWSPVGVATEYLKDTIVLRNYKKQLLPALSERNTIIINGITYEDDLTSGGAADLPDALAGKVHTLDYKTLRYPGHYTWVQKQISGKKNTNESVNNLQLFMEKQIPHIEDDHIILYAAVEGKDKKGTLRRREVSKCIYPQKVGKHVLRAIQITTASPLLQAAQLLLENSIRGVVLQSQLNTEQFLNGNFVIPVFGKI